LNSISVQTLINLKIEVSRKTSYKGEDSEDGDEKKLEAIGVKSEDKGISYKIVTDGGNIGLGPSSSGKESWDLCALVTLNNGKTVVVRVIIVSGEGRLTGLGSRGVEFGVTLDLKTLIGEGERGVGVSWSLVSTSRYVELDAGSINHGVSLGGRWGLLGRDRGSLGLGLLCLLEGVSTGSLGGSLLGLGLLCLLEGVSNSTGGEGRGGECTGVGQETGKGDGGNRLHFELI